MSAHLHQSLSSRRQFLELMRRAELLEHLSAVSPVAEGRLRPAWLFIEQAAEMHFAGTEVSDVQIGVRDKAIPQDVPDVRVRQRFFGLFAPYGPLPLYVTEHALLEKRVERNEAFERFVNTICCNLAWLYYVAHSSMHPVLGADRLRSAFVERVGAFADAGTPTFVQAPRALACRRAFPGAYCAPRRALRDLQTILRSHFDVSVRVVPRYGRWVTVPHTPSDARRVGAWHLGTRVWDIQHTIMIMVGPIDAEALVHWHRGSQPVMDMASVVADFLDGRLDVVICLEVRTHPAMVGRVGRMRLGVDAWSRLGYGLRTFTLYESFREHM